MNIKDINEVGKEARGMKHLVRHLEGKELTQNQAIEANCYGCMGGYTDGKQDCKIPECSLHPFMPYREGGPRKLKAMSEEQRRKASERMRSLRSSKSPRLLEDLKDDRQG